MNHIEFLATATPWFPLECGIKFNRCFVQQLFRVSI